MLRHLPNALGVPPATSWPETAGEPPGMYGHAIVRRVPAGVDAGRLREHLAGAAEAVLPGLAALSDAVLLEEPVPGPATGLLARSRREREARRPIAANALRLVLLTYSCGSSDLVVVAHQASLDRRSLDLLAGITITGELPATAETGLAALTVVDPASRDRLVERLRRHAGGAIPGGSRMAGGGDPATMHEHRVPLPRLERTGRLRADLLAALGLTLARSTGGAGVVLGALSPTVGGDPGGLGAFERPAITAFDVDDELTVGAYRDAVGELWDGAGKLWHTTELERAIGGGGPLAPVGLVLAEDAVDGRYVAAQAALYPVTVHVEPDASGALHAVCRHRSADAPCWWVAQFARRFGTACRAVLIGPQDRPLAELDLLRGRERREIAELGRTPRTRATEADLIHRAVAAQATAAPDSVAITDAEGALTYRELDDRANRLAQALRRRGVEDGDRVGVCLARSAEAVSVLLAVFKAGGAYVPLDPEYPAARLAYVAEDAGLALIVADAETAERFPGQVVLRADELSVLAAECSATAPESGVVAGDPAYVIYTSGSTGRPKGVVVAHGSVLALLAGTSSEFAFSAQDTWTWFHSMAFDFSVWEIWGCLVTGGRLVVVPHWTCRSPEDFRDLLLLHKVTILNQTPSAFAQLLELERRRPSELAVRLIVFGGEPLDARMLLPWFDVYPESACRLVNMFGITETTVHVTAQTVTRAEALAGSRSVGRAIGGWSIRVLDRSHRLLPPGAAGEIAVGGDGLALRYLNQPELTEQRFITDANTGERLYLSGDRGRLLPDGSLEHLGRLDNQVKVRGYRIELDEIRKVLLEDPTVIAAAVILQRGDRGDAATARLDAYVVLSSPDDAKAPQRLRAGAAKLLPDYMVPSTVTVVSSLPLTANGKLDVEQLPSPSLRHEPECAAASGRETMILEAWRSVLGQHAGPRDDFFDLGGNSLLAVRLVAALRGRGFANLAIHELYRHPTARDLALHLDEPDADAVAAARAAVS